MSIKSIKPLAPSVCPQCSAERMFLVTREKIECQRCGYALHNQKMQAAPVQRDLKQYKPTYRITHRGGVEGYVEAAYTTAMDCVRREDWEGAVKALYRCIDYRADFTDAHLWLGRLLDDAAKRRDHLTTVLAHEPTHPEALRELMILDGEIEDPSAHFNEYTMPEVREVNGAVSTITGKINCPRCGSPALTDDEASGTLVCSSCGHRQNRNTGIGRFNSFSAALIKQRSKPVRWIVGERWLQCKACSSTRTVSKEQLSETCPFCGSKNVIEQDALDTFRQPDGLVPFEISDKRAMANVHEALKGFGEKLRGFFNPNRVKRAEHEGIFLPFWVFDCVVDVQRTIIERRTHDREYRPVTPYRVETLPEMKNNVLVPAVTSPPRSMTGELGKYRLTKAVAYEPGLIAQHAAEIYSIDFDKAAMDAHELVSSELRSKYGGSPMSETQITVTPMMKQMTFRLLLLPVWSVTLFEEDGDVRPVLVNGQTGKVVLGKAKKALR
jgi:DNA-directed RNA polymerase subunit M/transcription elongation factor TFIIS